MIDNREASQILDTLEDVRQQLRCAEAERDEERQACAEMRDGQRSMLGVIGDLKAKLKQAEDDRDEARSGYHLLDANWDRMHNAALGAIRDALQLPEATVPELCRAIAALKAHIATVEGEKEKLGRQWLGIATRIVTAVDAHRGALVAHLETLSKKVDALFLQCTFDMTRESVVRVVTELRRTNDAAQFLLGEQQALATSEGRST